MCLRVYVCVLNQYVFALNVIVDHADVLYVFVALVLFAHTCYMLYRDPMSRAVILEMVLLGTRWTGMLADRLSVHA